MQKPQTRYDAKSGFLTVDVLVAFIVAALVGTAALQTLILAARIADETRQQEIALRTGQAILKQALYAPTTTINPGQFAKDLDIEVNISPWDIGNGELGVTLQVVNVIVRYEGRKREKSIHLSALRPA